MEIKEGNKLIAEFMGGVETVENHWIEFKTPFVGSLKACRPDALQFHSSWDWLMPVVEKIRTLRDNMKDDENGLAYSTISIHFEANGHNFNGKDNNYRVHLLGDLVYKRMINSSQHEYDKVEGPSVVKHSEDGKQALWETIVEFINWYNNHLTPPL